MKGFAEEIEAFHREMEAQAHLRDMAPKIIESLKIAIDILADYATFTGYTHPEMDKIIEIVKEVEGRK